MSENDRKITRRELAVGIATDTYPGDSQRSPRDLLSRLLERELTVRYDRLGNRKVNR